MHEWDFLTNLEFVSDYKQLMHNIGYLLSCMIHICSIGDDDAILYDTYMHIYLYPNSKV